MKLEILYGRLFGIAHLQVDGINTVPTSIVGYLYCWVFGHRIPVTDVGEEFLWSACGRCGTEDDRNLIVGRFTKDNWRRSRLRERIFPFVHLCRLCHLPMFSTRDEYCDRCWIEPSHTPWDD